MSGGRRKGGDPRRRITGAQLKREILVFAEGRVTEEQYLVHWHRRYRDRVFVRIDDFRGGPLQLVEQAVQAKEHAAREARRGRGRAYDEIWCLHDVDEHEKLPDAADLAVAHGINLAVSNPCIELWFILHFEDHTAHIERAAAQSRSKDLLACKKSLTDNALFLLEERYDDAAERARKLDVKHAGDGSPLGTNPSSGVWRLVDSIRSA